MTRRMAVLVLAIALTSVARASGSGPAAWARGVRAQMSGDRASASKSRVETASAFQVGSVAPRAWSAVRYNAARALSWSHDGRLLAMTTLVDDDEAGNTEPVGTWLLETTGFEPLYYSPVAYADVVAMADGTELLVRVSGEPGRVEWHQLARGITHVVELPEKIAPLQIAVSGDDSTFAIRANRHVCVATRADSSARCFRARLRRVGLNHDGSRFLGTTVDAFVIGDTTTGRTLHRRKAAKNSPVAVARSGRTATFVDRRGVLVVDASTGQPEWRIANSQLQEAEEAKITALALDPSGAMIATLQLGELLHVFAKSGQLKLQTLVPASVAWFEVVDDGPLAFSPDGRRLFAGPVLLDTQTGERLPDGRRDDPPIGGAPGIDFSTDGTQVRTEFLYASLRSGKGSSPEAFAEADRLLDRSVDGRFVAKRSTDKKSVALFDALRPRWNKRVWQTDETGERSIVFARFLPDHITLLLTEHGSESGTRHLVVDARDGTVAQEIEALTGCMQAGADLSPDGRGMLIECFGKPYYWDFHSARPRKLSDAYVEGLSFAGPKHAVFTEEGGRFRLSLETGRRERLSPRTKGYNCRGSSVRGLAVTCHGDGLRVWNRDREIARLDADAEATITWAFGPNDTVALLLWDRIDVYSTKSGAHLLSLDGRIVRSPDGHFDILGEVPDLRCRYDGYVLPFASCEKTHRTPGLLAKVWGVP